MMSLVHTLVFLVCAAAGAALAAGDSSVVDRVPEKAVVEYRRGIRCREGRESLTKCWKYWGGKTEVEMTGSKDDPTTRDHAYFAFNTTEHGGKDVEPVLVGGAAVSVYLVQDQHAKTRFWVSGLLTLVLPEESGSTMQMWVREGRPFRMEVMDHTRQYGKKTDFEWVQVTVTGKENTADQAQEDASGVEEQRREGGTAADPAGDTPDKEEL
jgi:hypothetical protein